MTKNLPPRFKSIFYITKNNNKNLPFKFAFLQLFERRHSRLLEQRAAPLQEVIVAAEEELQQDVGAEAGALGGGQEDGQRAGSADDGVVELLRQGHQALHGGHAV